MPSSDDDVCACGHKRREHTAGAEPPFEACDRCRCLLFWTTSDSEPFDYMVAEKAQEAAAPHERRPPYAVAYSAGGVAYEAMLPGDATVVAVDGVLKISHHDRMVVGIMRVQPVNINEERSADGTNHDNQ